MSVPSAPIINPQPRSSDGTFELAWQPPLDDGGSAITGYSIGFYGDSNYAGLAYGDGTPANSRYLKIQAPGFLPNGTSYWIQLTAINANGESQPARFRAPWQSGDKPGTPASISATRNGTSAVVTWTPPSILPNATIFWYVIRAFSDNPADPTLSVSVDGGSSECIISGLNPSSEYCYSVWAVNCPGYSPIPKTTCAVLRLWLQGIQYTNGSTTWYDESGNGNTVTLLNGIAQNNSPDNDAVYLDGSSYWGRASLGYTTFSINVWWRDKGTLAYESPCIITEAWAGGPINYVITRGQGIETGKWACGFFDASWAFGTPFTLPNNTWINIQFTWDGTNLVTYINGVSIGTQAHPGKIAQSTGLGLNLGKRWDVSGVGSDQYMTGDLGEVRIYEGVLMPGQVLQAYNESLPNFS